MKQKICQIWLRAKRKVHGAEHPVLFTPCSMLHDTCYLLSLAQVSFRLTVRLKTSLPAVLS